MSDYQSFRERAVQALTEMNERIDADKTATQARELAEAAERGVRRAKAALHGTKVGIAGVVALAAATASIWDLMRLMGELGADERWGIVAGGAIDLGWVYFLLEIYTHRDDPAKALKPYSRTGKLLLLSAALNGLSGVLSGGQGLGMVVLAVVSVLMPLLLKGVITPLILGGSLTAELLATRKGRARVMAAARDRQGRALAAFDASYRLESERAEHSAQVELQRQRATFEIQRETIALELLSSREELAHAAFESSRARDEVQAPESAPQVQAAPRNDVPQIQAAPRNDVPQVQNLIPAPAPATSSAATSSTSSDEVQNGTAVNNGDEGTVSDLRKVRRAVNNGGTVRNLPTRGSATAAIRELLSSGVREVSEIRSLLEQAEITPPSDTYIHRLVRQAKAQEETDPNNRFGQYL